MFIGKFENAYGEEFWDVGETIEDTLKSLGEVTGDTLHPDNITWYDASPVNVICETKYIVVDR